MVDVDAITEEPQHQPDGDDDAKQCETDDFGCPRCFVLSDRRSDFRNHPARADILIRDTRQPCEGVKCVRVIFHGCITMHDRAVGRHTDHQRCTDQQPHEQQQRFAAVIAAEPVCDPDIGTRPENDQGKRRPQRIAITNDVSEECPKCIITSVDVT